MRFYTTQHPLYCGIDLHARSMDICILNQESEIMLHRNMQASPETFLKAIVPSRDAMVVAVECLFTWYWLADLCAHAGIPCVLGHALSMKAIHGGKAKNDTIDAHKIAVVLRGGMLPQASVSPAAMRATRDLLRRRMHLMRKRAELLAHLQKTNSQYNLPEIGKKLAYKGNRDGVAERCLEPAVQQSIEVDLALIDHDDRLRSDVALTIVQTAQQHHAQALYRRQSVPGIGKIVRWVLLYEMHGYHPLPTGPGLCVLLPLGQRRQGVCRETLRHLRQKDWECLSHVGLVGSGRSVSTQQCPGPAVAGPFGDKTRSGQSVDDLGPQVGARRLLHVDARHGI